MVLVAATVDIIHQSNVCIIIKNRLDCGLKGEWSEKRG